ncbi:hypothetical protein FHS42_003916 [Streptomyces zagrosensis]|uniref:Uncharacterized protein n=1 Tax=Streptomyces zagrosensis TaxID=1042984 RepID=A0A7W9V0K2_9ACTN|nr:hypothetical protein [Streptomyces zagrosensis]
MGCLGAGASELCVTGVGRDRGGAGVLRKSVELAGSAWLEVRG